MLRSKRNRNRHAECSYGCCHDGISAKVERRIARRREKREWKNA